MGLENSNNCHAYRHCNPGYGDQGVYKITETQGGKEPKTMNKKWKTKIQESVWPIVLGILVTLALIMMVFYCSGCGTVVEGVRLAPKEPLRQQGDQAARLAQAGAFMPYPPGSPASQSLAQATSAVQGYIGTPKSPLITNPMVQAAHETYMKTERNKVRSEILTNWLIRGTKLMSRRMSDIAEQYSKSEGKVITKLEAIRNSQVINDQAEALFIAAGEIAFEDEGATSADLVEQIQLAISDANKSAQAARLEGQKRLTAGELVDKGAEGVDSILSKVGDLASRYGLEGVFGLILFALLSLLCSIY